VSDSIVRGDLRQGLAIPTPDEAHAAWLVDRTAALRAFVCERMRVDVPPYHLSVIAYPEEARLAVKQECEARGWAVAIEDAERTRPSLMGRGERYTVKIMKVWQP
jgi:hypothetical protein